MEQNMSVIKELLPALTSGKTGVWLCDVATGNIEFKNDFFILLGLKQLNVEFTTLSQLRELIQADGLQAFDGAFKAAENGKNSNAAYCLASLNLETTFLPSPEGVIACTISKPTMQQDWEKQYKTLVNTLFPNFIFVFDYDFHYLDVITPDGLRLFHTREELLGQDARQFYPPEVSELLITNIRECLNTNTIKEVQHHIELHGSRYYYQARIVPVDGDKAFCLIQDIGDRVRRMEELLVQRQRAEESNKMKSALIENMSHEIRTPLNAIVGFSEFLVNELMPEKRQKFIDIVRNNNSMLLQIVNDILDLSRLEAGMSEFCFEKIDVIELFTEITEANICKTKTKVRLIPHLPDNNLYVHTDATRVKQVLNNLISNAIKFTTNGSIILDVEEDADHLTFSVSDEGCGIEENKLDVIFERFEKLSRFTQGTGLGLTICKAIVERLGGKITVESVVNKGSRFSFTIPYRQPEIRKPSIGDTRELMGNQRKKIMVVETSVDDMKSISDILIKKYDIVEIADNDKIVSSFILDQPNLVIMNMETVSNKEIINKIRAIAPSIPIIAITTSDFYHDQRWALENGCTDVISKPFSPSRLEEVVLAFVV